MTAFSFDIVNIQPLNMLKHICGILWIATYLLVLRRGYLDNSYGIPAVAILMNIAWEIYDPFFANHSIMKGYGIVWLILDIFILRQMIAFHNKKRPRESFKLPTVYVLWIMTYFILLFIDAHYQIRLLTDAFFQNAIMSLLFIQMIISRKDISGQSLYIAVGKMMATGIVIVMIMIHEEMKPLHLIILVADIAYIILYIHYARMRSVNILTRI
jgi:hypothetical protein